MDIKPTSTTPQLPSSTGNAVAPQNIEQQHNIPPQWKTAQIIEAVIIKITDKELFLNIQGTITHTAKPAIANLQPGNSLKLQLNQLTPVPQFRILNVNRSDSAHQVNPALKFLSAEQSELQPLMKNIAFVATRPSLRPAPLAPIVNAAVREIFQNIPRPVNLKTASQVKSHIENSGVFLESKIKDQILTVLHSSRQNKIASSQNKLDLNPDFRVQLLRLAELIKSQPSLTSKPQVRSEQNTGTPVIQTNNPGLAANNTTATTRSAMTDIGNAQASLLNITRHDEAMHTILRQVESSLNHMQQTQLHNLNESQPGRPVWLFELPVKDGQDIDLFKIRINQDETSASQAEAKKTWSVTLEFDFAGLGRVKSQIKLQDNFISALFFSEQPRTLALFNENFELLRNRLSYNGLNVGPLESKQKNLSTEPAPVIRKQLDERT